MSEFLQKIIRIQTELNAPKGQYNSFGKYNYRSCEDILSALKPLLAREGVLQYISDEVVSIESRFYVKATVTLTDGTNSLSNSSFAREEETKKGADGSQITGTASSYARKYALNGMYNIDDAKDADTDEHAKQTKQEEKPKPSKQEPHHEETRTPPQLLAAFTQYAAKAGLPELENAWKAADRSLKGCEEHNKAKDIYDIRKNELELPA